MSAQHVRKIAASMKRVGFLPSKPVQVCKNGRRFGIIDGHHRFSAAKLLGIPFYYVEEPFEHSELIGEENSLVRKWSNKSFVNLYASRGNRHFQIVSKWLQKGYSISNVISLLCGKNSITGGNGLTAIADGSFTVKTESLIQAVDDFISPLVSICPALRLRYYMDAINMLSRVEECDLELLSKRIKANPTMIVPCANRDQSLDVLDEIYNFRTRDKINIAFIAKHKTSGTAKA
jgi:hypothetical protein